MELIEPHDYNQILKVHLTYEQARNVQANKWQMCIFKHLKLCVVETETSSVDNKDHQVAAVASDMSKTGSLSHHHITVYLDRSNTSFRSHFTDRKNI